MNTSYPTGLGWYPDEQTGGTKFWDGRQWTGDLRPPRKRFAAAAHHRGGGITACIIGGLCFFSSPSQLTNPSPETTDPAASFVAALVLSAALVVWGVYLLRGQGPTTKAVLERIRRERLASDAYGTPPAHSYFEPAPAFNSASNTSSNTTTDQTAAATITAAQIQAISDPETARALQNLQALLYTRTISPEEFQRAKNKLLGDN